MEYSINTNKIDKFGWIDNNWLSYQNINFLKDPSGNIFLAGRTSNENGENVLDLFEIETEDLTMFTLKKIFSKKFDENKQTKFRWGAGIHLTEDNQLRITSCGEHIKKESFFNLYK